MNSNRYRVVLGLHIVFILVDLLLNTLVDVFKPENVVQLGLYLIQDTLILINIIIIFLMFFSTYVFQAGLIWLLISQFSVPIVVSLTYLGVSIALHVWKLTLCWNDPRISIWKPSYLSLFVVQRTVSILFYYFYKDTILRIADPRFYKRSQWIQVELLKRN